jgi:TPR repeat protein
MKRVEANDAASIYVLASFYYHGDEGLQQDHAKSTELFVKAAELGSRRAHFSLGMHYKEGGDYMKKAKFHLEAAAMAGNEDANTRSNLGGLGCNAGNMEQALKHWTIAALAGHHEAMHELRTRFEKVMSAGNQSSRL